VFFIRFRKNEAHSISEHPAPTAPASGLVTALREKQLPCHLSNNRAKKISFFEKPIRKRQIYGQKRH
jgi:hypothetical protein